MRRRGPSRSFSKNAREEHNDGDKKTMDDQILDSITMLGNTVLTNKALAELNRFKAKKALGFQNPALFKKAMDLLASHSYRIPQYRFVIDMFDKSVLRRIVLEDDDDDSFDSTGEDDA